MACVDSAIVPSADRSLLNRRRRRKGAKFSDRAEDTQGCGNSEGATVVDVRPDDAGSHCAGFVNSRRLDLGSSVEPSGATADSRTEEALRARSGIGRSVPRSLRKRAGIDFNAEPGWWIRKPE